MANRRMLDKTITESDAFLDLPFSTQALYLHLVMGADDDGFINNYKRIYRGIGATSDDLQKLIDARFVISFDSGVIVIKHWKLCNKVPKDRYKPTVYTEEMAKLQLKDNSVYTLYTECNTKCIQNVDSLYTQDRVGKDRVGKDRIGEGRVESVRPTLAEVKAYCKERHNNINPNRFYEYYEANGWTTKGDPITDWKAKVRSWETNNIEDKYSEPTRSKQRLADFAKEQEERDYKEYLKQKEEERNG